MGAGLERARCRSVKTERDTRHRRKKRKKTAREKQETRELMLCGALYGGEIVCLFADWPELALFLYILLAAVGILEGLRER